nr:hypothetical protein BaRGS_010335 [Batillaria attramentaria]
MDEKKGEENQAVTFDDALRGLGDFGPYQRRVFFLMCLLASTCGIQTLMTVFTMATPDHRFSIVVTADLVCDKNTYHATADMVYMVGVLVGSLVAGVFSDRSVAILKLTIANVSGLELVGSSYRTLAGSVIQMFWPVALSWLLLVLSNIGKLGASAAFSIIYLFSAELFPTVARNSLMGASSMIARLGGIVSPYIAQLVSEADRVIVTTATTMMMMTTTTMMMVMMMMMSQNVIVGGNLGTSEN